MNVWDRLLSNEERYLIDLQHEDFKQQIGLFGLQAAKSIISKKLSAQWWDSYGDHCLDLQKFAFWILSLTYIPSRRECNWIAFEMVNHLCVSNLI